VGVAILDASELAAGEESAAALSELQRLSDPGLPYDGYTLKDQIAQVEGLTGVPVTRAYVDKGYRGHGLAAPDIHVSQSPGDRTPTIKRELRRSSAIEPVVGHTKSDGLLERNRLAGARGDAINTILVGAGHNIRLLLAWLRTHLFLFLALVASTLSPRKFVDTIARHAL
jgi:IS5 family transposase